MGVLRWLQQTNDTTDASDGEIKNLTNQFYVTLRASFANVEATLNGQSSSPALKRSEELLQLNRKPTWSDAYEVEQMLVHLMDDSTLKTELDVRSLEARSALRPQLADLYMKELSEAKTTEKQRTLLARLVNDLQWRYTVNEVKRWYSKDITRRTGYLFTAALSLFGLWTAYIVLVPPVYADLRLLILAALVGTWGATFSMLAGLKGRLENSELDDLKLMRPWVILVSRALIGTGAGSVLYFFVRSGLLGGSAFPNLTNADIPSSPGKELALLTVWCFVAGFSEKFVPSLLDKTESRAASTDTDRLRPGPPAGANVGQPGPGPTRSEASPQGSSPTPGGTRDKSTLPVESGQK